MHNAELIGRNMALSDWSKEIIERHKKTVERNTMLMKENARLYRTLRVLRQKMKSPAVIEAQLATTGAAPSGLETLADITTAFEEERPVETQQRQTRSATRGKGAASKNS